MIPHTYPSQLDSDNRTQMVIYYLTSITGLERWKDYIPVRENSSASPELNSFNTNGAIFTTTLSSISGKQAWVDYVPVYRDDLATDAWSISAVGYLATKDEIALRALAIIASYGTNAHVYLPGVGTISGLTTGNFVESTGVTPTTKDNPVGLVLDGAGDSVARRNLLTYSEQFDNAAWVKNNTTVTSNTTTAPNGTITADTITSSSANGYIYQQFSAVAGTTYTFSCYVKSVSSAVTLDIALLNASGASGIVNVSFTTTGDWTRVSATGTSATTQTAWVAFGTGASFNTGETFYAWGAQLEVGTSPTTYQQIVAGTGEWATGTHATQGTTANKPILRKGVVNYVLYSSDITNAVWLGSPTKVNAETFSSAGGASLYQTITVTPNTTYAYTWEAKFGTGTGVTYAVYNNTGASFILAETAYTIGVNNSSYSRVGIRFTTPSGCTSIRIYPIGGTSSVGTFNIKNHMLTTVAVKNGVAIGDSFTSAAIYTIQAALTSTTPITNKGTSGNTLTQIQARFATDVVALAPQYVVIQGGINDLANAVSDPVSGMQTQITTMVGQAQATGIRPIICNTSPWGTFSSKWTAQRQAWQDTYNAWLTSYCNSNGITLVDINTLLKDPSNPLNLLPAYDSGDGLHPSTAGYKVMGVAVATAIGLPNYDIVQTTTAPASSSTGNYHWIADSTDLLTATYPAGYESATVINALAAGQQTLTAQNIVGSYSIGPSVDTYGRFIFRTGLTASELTTMQTFANRLAGV